MIRWWFRDLEWRTGSNIVSMVLSKSFTNSAFKFTLLKYKCLPYTVTVNIKRDEGCESALSMLCQR